MGPKRPRKPGLPARNIARAPTQTPPPLTALTAHVPNQSSASSRNMSRQTTSGPTTSLPNTSRLTTSRPTTSRNSTLKTVQSNKFLNLPPQTRPYRTIYGRLAAPSPAPQQPAVEQGSNFPCLQNQLPTANPPAFPKRARSLSLDTTADVQPAKKQKIRSILHTGHRPGEYRDPEDEEDDSSFPEVPRASAYAAVVPLSMRTRSTTARQALNHNPRYPERGSDIINISDDDKDLSDDGHKAAQSPDVAASTSNTKKKLAQCGLSWADRTPSKVVKKPKLARSRFETDPNPYLSDLVSSQLPLDARAFESASITILKSGSKKSKASLAHAIYSLTDSQLNEGLSHVLSTLPPEIRSTLSAYPSNPLPIIQSPNYALEPPALPRKAPKSLAVSAMLLAQDHANLVPQTASHGPSQRVAGLPLMIRPQLIAQARSRIRREQVRLERLKDKLHARVCKTNSRILNADLSGTLNDIRLRIIELEPPLTGRGRSRRPAVMPHVHIIKKTKLEADYEYCRNAMNLLTEVEDRDMEGNRFLSDAERAEDLKDALEQLAEYYVLWPAELDGKLKDLEGEGESERSGRRKDEGKKGGAKQGGGKKK